MNKGHIIFGYDLVVVVLFFFFLRMTCGSWYSPFFVCGSDSRSSLHIASYKRQKEKPRRENENIWSRRHGLPRLHLSSPFLAKVRDLHRISQRPSKNKNSSEKEKILYTLEVKNNRGKNNNINFGCIFCIYFFFLYYFYCHFINSTWWESKVSASLRVDETEKKWQHPKKKQGIKRRYII
jgi:hypothetical protein